MVHGNDQVWTAEDEVAGFSRASTTANASPSMGAYLDSVDEVKRLPTNVIFQPRRQQYGFLDVHKQCFWRSQKPMPPLLKSVARHVSLSLSKISTPLLISSMMTIFVSSNSLSSLSDHLNGVLGCSRVRKGCILSADANAYATWLTSPNQLLTSVMVHGLGKSLIASRTCGHGRTVVGVISNPAKGTVSLANENFDGLRITPFRPQVSRNFESWKKLLSMEGDHISVSSMTFVLLSMSLIISSNRLV